MSFFISSLLIVPLKINAQSNLNNQFDQFYNVNKGDTKTYEYTALSGIGEHSVSSIILENGSIETFNISVGFRYEVRVAEKISSTNVTTQQIVNVPHEGKLVSEKSKISLYLLEAFDNQSMAKKYVDYENNYFNSNTVKLSLQSSNLVESINMTSKLGNQALYLSSIYSWDWQSGWLKYSQLKMTLGNGTLYVLQRTELVNGSIASSSLDLNFLVTIGILIVIPVFFISGAIIALKLRRKKKI